MAFQTWVLVCLALALSGCSGGSSVTAIAQSLPIVTTWTRVDGGGAPGINFSSSLDSNSATGAAFAGKVYLAWIEKDSSGNYQLRARVYDGNDAAPSWASVDGGDPNNGLNVDPTQSAITTPRMAVAYGKLYLAWHEPTASSTLSHVAVYNGNDASSTWTPVDGASPGTGGINLNATKGAFYPVIVENAGKLYATWYEPGTGAVYQVRAAVYNGNDSAPSWSMVDGGSTKGLNFNSSDTVGNPTLISISGKLYAAWSEGLAQTVRVKVYNGNDAAPVWTFVDLGGLNHSASSKAATPTLAVLANKLYAVWSEQASGSASQIRAAVYGGNDAAPSWAFVDGNGASGINIRSSNNAANPTLAVYGGILYSAWKEQLGNGGDYGIRVANYNGDDNSPAWSAVDSGNLSFSSSDNAEFPALIATSDRLFCAWDEETVPGKGQIHVSSGN